MAIVICHHNGIFNIYNTISDGFRFPTGITKSQLEAVIKEEFGSRGFDNLPQRIERAERFGHSSHEIESLDDFLCCNRAGKDEAFLETDEIIERFLTKSK